MNDFPFGYVVIVALILGAIVSIALRETDAFEVSIVFAFLFGLAKFILMT